LVIRKIEKSGNLSHLFMEFEDLQIMKKK
jgi:hypothetical protein